MKETAVDRQYIWKLKKAASLREVAFFLGFKPEPIYKPNSVGQRPDHHLSAISVTANLQRPTRSFSEQLLA